MAAEAQFGPVEFDTQPLKPRGPPSMEGTRPVREPFRAREEAAPEEAEEEEVRSRASKPALASAASVLTVRLVCSRLLAILRRALPCARTSASATATLAAPRP